MSVRLPSVNSPSLTSVTSIEVISPASGADMVAASGPTGQVSSVFLRYTLYVPADNSLKVFEA